MGALSYVLFGVASDVVVRTRPYGSTITAQDVGAGCEWICGKVNMCPNLGMKRC